jgi:hypothetical protein
MNNLDSPGHQHTLSHWESKDGSFHTRRCECGYEETKPHDYDTQEGPDEIVGETYKGGMYWPVYGYTATHTCKFCHHNYVTQEMHPTFRQ